MNGLRATILWAIPLFVSVLMMSALGKQREPKPYPFPKLSFFPPMPVAADNPVTVEGAELGRFLFYDPILSADSTISCASCHRQEAAFSDGPMAFSKGINGVKQRRNTLPLFNLAWYPAYFWDGRAASMEAQVFEPVRAHDEMNLNWPAAEKRIARSQFYRRRFAAAFGDTRIDSVRIARAIAQFERTLISNRSKYDLAITNRARFTPDERAGFELANDMTKADCLHCHTTDADALGTTGQFSNNGLDSIFNPFAYPDAGRGKITGKTTDYGKFKTPSLRNLAFTAPYMHDGRFATLEEVVNFYSHGVHSSANVDSRMGTVRTGGAQLTPLQQKQLVAFLLTLSDSAFVNDRRFAAPSR
ncbi:MAG: cytochrome-c peroxidase [Bacteroidia bacterium]|jgi:cytochrome c peroxidase|nr:cytochrome-c peroxidase [Bacteroidia bacterium]